jgi:hypothetical protein
MKLHRYILLFTIPIFLITAFGSCEIVSQEPPCYNKYQIGSWDMSCTDKKVLLLDTILYDYIEVRVYDDNGLRYDFLEGGFIEVNDRFLTLRLEGDYFRSELFDSNQNRGFVYLIKYQ